MGKLERVIAALEALPEARQEEIAEIVLEFLDDIAGQGGQSELTDEQRAEVLRRRDAPRLAGSPERLERILAKYA